MAFALGFSASHCLNHRALSSLLLPTATTPIPSQISALTSYLPSLSTKSASGHHMKLKHLPGASAEGVPRELIEDSKFVPLNADDPVYGPPALLLLGFEVDESVKIQEFLKELGGEFVQVIFCTEDMINKSLWEAVHTSQPSLETVKIAKSLPRICFFSGLSGEEMTMFIDAFSETGLEAAVFAALVPNSADKPLQELIEEIMGDHEMLTAKQPSST